MAPAGSTLACVLLLMKQADPVSGSADTLMRASRFALRLPVRYRLAGEPRWHQGQTDNISYSGVLFRAEGLINVNTPIELRVALSADTRERPHPEVFCHARIVRTMPPTQGDPRPALAASIEQYQLLPAPLGSA